MKKPPKKIMVGLKGAGDAEELIGLATRVAGTEAKQIVVLHVVEVPPATPLDAEDEALEKPAREIEREVKRVAKKLPKVKFDVRVYHARHTGKAVVDELEKGKFDLAVVGYHHKKTFSEMLLGTTARYLTENTPCPLLMTIPPRPKS